MRIRQRLNLTNGILIGILLLGAVLRFQHLDGIEHNVDHAYPIWQALMTLDRGVWPITAQGTSVLFANPALTGYLLLPWVALTRSPLGAYIFVITLNTLAIWLAYRAAVYLLDSRQALIAALLMAINPWLIEYTRTTWVQALLPFGACLVFWLLIPVLIGIAPRPRRRTILALIALTALTQTYLLAFALLIPVSVLLVVFRRRVNWRSVVAGALIFAIATAIYGLGLAGNSAETLDRLRSFTGGTSQLSAEAWKHALRLVSGEDYPISRGMTAPITDSTLRQNLSQAVHDVILVLLLIGIALTVYDLARRRPDAERGLLALIWFALPILLMTYVSKPVHPFYLLLTLPAGYVLTARGAGVLLRWRLTTITLVVAALPVTLLLSINTLRFAQATLAHPGAHGLRALPVAAGIDMAHILLGAQGLVVADGDEWSLNSFAGRLFPVETDVNTSQTTYVAPMGTTYLFFSDNATSPVVPINASDPETFRLADGSTVQRYRVLPDAIPIGSAVQSDLGISYLGWNPETALAPGQTSTLLTYWRIDSLLPARGQWLLGPFVHVYDGSWQRVAIGGGPVVPGTDWHLGELFIHRLDMTIPTNAVGPFTLQIGEYDGVHNLNAIFALPDGSNNAVITVRP